MPQETRQKVEVRYKSVPTPSGKYISMAYLVLVEEEAPLLNVNPLIDKESSGTLICETLNQN